MNIYKHASCQSGPRAAQTDCASIMILLLLLFLHYLWAKDLPRPNSKYFVRHITSCPVEGYYFKRELAPNSLGPGDCYLCFCQGDDTAVCWLRENRRCDAEGYHHHNVGKRDARKRRSPMSLGELFFKDAAKEVFNKQTPEVCKPFESSFSEGCPPEDWCTGCTVCDCNANGRWDCHVLSFCDDDNGKTQMKKRRKSKPKVINSNKKSITKSTKKVSKAQEKNKPSKNNNKITKRAPAPSMAPTRNKNTIKKGKNPPKPVIFKKDAHTRKPFTLAQNKAKKVTNSPAVDQMTQEVVKKVVTVMQNLLRKQVTATVPEIIKIVQKKSMEMNNMYNKNQQKQMKNTVKRKVPTGNKKQYNRPVAVSKPPVKNNKVKNYNRPSTANRSPRKSTIMNKKANTKLMESYRYKRNAFLDNQTTTDMAPSVQLENFTNTTPIQYEELPENITFGNTAIDEYSLNPATRMSYNVTDIKSKTTDSTVDIKNTTNISGSQPLNYSDTVLDLSVTESLFFNTKVRSQIHNNRKRIHVLLDKIASANDLKYMKWSQIKLYKQKEKELRSQSNNTISSSSSIIDKMPKNYSKVFDLATESKVKMHIFQHHVQRKLDDIPKRFNITRVVSTIACNPKHEDTFYAVNSINGSTIRNGPPLSKKIGNLQSILKKLLTEFQRNNTTIAKTRGKLNVVKYLKKFFKKLFYTNKKKSNNNTQTISNKRTIETLCASFGPCVINKRNRVVLRRKLKELNSETHLMMTSINIIKGLLRLLDFSNIDQSTNFSGWKEKSNLTDDIQKLSIILKRQYSNTKYLSKLSETQLTQIDYIKNNTQVFIQSVVRFVNILNDVIDILTVKNNKVHAQHKNTAVINNHNNFKTQGLLKKIKQLLVKYNIVQNTFMSKMYELLNLFQQNITSSGINESDPKGNEGSDMEATNRFSNNILRNVRKLKNISETLSTGGRKKRQLNRNDDAMEYLLTIMEYLMKKKHSVDFAPVNDGIDLLIEAIQHAPDIKPIKNQVHVYIPLKKTRAEKTSSEDMSDDSDSDSNANLSKGHNFTSKIDIAKTIHTDQSFKDEKSYRPSKFVKRIENEEDIPSFLGIDNTTENQLQTKLNNDYPVEKNTSVPIELKSEYGDDVTVGNHADKEHSNIDTEAVLDGRGGNRNYEVFVAEYEDDTDSEEVVNATTNASELLTKYSPPTIPLPPTEDTLLFKYSDRKIRNFYDGFITNGSVKFIPKSTLQWVDTEDEEDKPDVVKYSRETATDPVTEALTQRVTTNQQAKKNPDDTSNMSKELDDEDKKKLSKVNADQVMFKKQMNLLNSLDYGTEGPVVDDSDSKDVRYPNDGYDL